MSETIHLCFNYQNHLLVTKGADGVFGVSDTADLDLAWHRVTEFECDAGQRKLVVALVEHEPFAEAEFKTIYDLRSEQLTQPLREVLDAIGSYLYRIPYLGMGENEYIYRFRTSKERNRSVYIDSQSEALYQSKLCAAIKAARRTKEKTSGEPVELDFGAVSYVIPSHFGFCLGVQNAIERAYETVAINPGKRVYMLSELIHNPYVNEDLLARGLRYLQTDKGLPLRADGSPANGADDPEALWNQLTSEDIVIVPDRKSVV